MSGQPTASAVTGLQIPADTQMKFSAIVAMIMGSESMNMEERQYWINILPIMTQDQLKNLEDILKSEKQQLAAIDAKYAKNAQTVDAVATVATMEHKIQTRKMEREQQENSSAIEEEEREKDILLQIQAI